MSIINKIYRYFGWHRWVYSNNRIRMNKFITHHSVSYMVYHCHVCNTKVFGPDKQIYDSKLDDDIYELLDQPAVLSCKEELIRKLHES